MYGIVWDTCVLSGDYSVDARHGFRTGRGLAISASGTSRVGIYIISSLVSVFHFFPTEGAFSPDPLSFPPHDISKFRERHETRRGV